MTRGDLYSRSDEFTTDTPTGASGASGSFQSSSGSTTQQAQQKASQAAERAQQQAKSQAASQKERAADRLGSVAQALRQTGQQLREQDQGSMAQYTEKAADQVEWLSDQLRNKDVNQLIGEAERVARRQPALFLGGAFALGLVGARFLKSSSQLPGEGTKKDTPWSKTSTVEAPLREVGIGST